MIDLEYHHSHLNKHKHKQTRAAKFTRADVLPTRVRIPLS